MKIWILIALLSSCSACSPSRQANEVTASEELIIGGHTASKRSEIVATTVSLVDTQRGSLCTASILSEDVAITAAHCVGGAARAMQLSFGPETAAFETRPVVDIAISPAWSIHHQDEFNNGDIALVRFTGGLPAGAAAASLMKASHHLSDGEIVILAGFGIMKADGEGAGRLRTVDVKIAKAHCSDTEVSLDQEGRRGACHGESGGPAFIQDNRGGLLLWGITSRGINDPSDSCSGQSVYTRIQAYSRWINTVVRSWKE